MQFYGTLQLTTSIFIPIYDSLAILEVKTLRHRIQGTLFCRLELKQYVKCTNNDSSVGKEFTCNSGDPQFNSWAGKICWRRDDYPLQYSWQISQEIGQVVWYSHLFKNFPQFVVIHTVKGFDIVNKAEIDVFLELSCFFDHPWMLAI